MAKGYWIARVDVHNDEGYKAYASRTTPRSSRNSAARFVVRAANSPQAKAQPLAQRGDRIPGLRDRARLLQFAGICQANIEVRQPHSSADLVIIEGYDGPQP